MSQSSEWIVEKLKAGAPFFAGKLGTSELDVLLCFLTANEQTPRILKNFFVNAGFWVPPGKKLEIYLEIWCRKILQALKDIDGIAAWINPVEKEIIDKYAPGAKILALRDLEPYYTSRWTLALQDDSILAVISPFAKSIQAQIPKLKQVWGSSSVWKPRQKFAPIQTFYSPELDRGGSSGWPQEILERGPFEAVNYIVEQVVNSGATHAIIGCGCLSLLIAHSLKLKGISAIHTGGATQIFFGIRGRRWESHSVISKFINDSWINPSADEIPKGAGSVEGGCYW